MHGEVDVQVSPFWLLLLTQPLTSEQHTRANLEFSSNFAWLVGKISLDSPNLIRSTSEWSWHLNCQKQLKALLNTYKHNDVTAAMFWLFFAVGSWEKDTNKSAAVMLLRMFLRSSAFRSKKLLYYLTNKSLLLRCFRLFMTILNFAVHLKKVYWSTPHNQKFFFKLLAPGIEPLTLGS